MALNEMIYKRKSCRSFTGVPVDAAMIEAIKAFQMKPLYPAIKVHWDIVPRNQVKCICPAGIFRSKRPAVVFHPWR